MQDHRTDGEPPTARANPSPPVGKVHGLGESHALRVDLEPVQVPWLADEIETLRSAILEALGRERAVARQPGANGEEVDRRRYQLRVLAMVREQLPLSTDVVRAVVSDPWEDANELAREAARITASVTVVGPARGMLVLIRGAARNVADALGEALRGPTQKERLQPDSWDYMVHWPELGRLTAPVATRLGDLAAAAAAFTETYVTAVRQQAYSFDPEHYPGAIDELW